MTKDEYQKEYLQHQAMRDHVKSDKYRLNYHLMPPTGYMNDPNGLCQKDGIYHIYFQYSPFNSGWGEKLWGHYTTQDMITFKEMNPFLYGDNHYDRNGAYSGSAFVEEDTIHYFYTGNVKLTDKEYDYINEGREQNTIHITSKDGIHTSKKELLLDNHDYPSDMSKHVRDPKIFKKGNYYYMVLGARTKDNKGCILLYRSDDLHHFTYYNRITTKEDFGYMWECPDLFELDGKLILITCPQGVPQDGYHYANIYQTGYFIIDYDFERNTYELSSFEELDYGFDIYAPQSFMDQKGRRILYAWMGIPDAPYHNQPTVDYEWQHALTMPKVLSLKKNKIIQTPIEEMKQLRKSPILTSIAEFKAVAPSEICFEMNIEFTQTNTLDIKIREDVHLTYTNNMLTLSLKESGCGREQRQLELTHLDSLTIFSDTSSLEIFINNGEKVMTSRVYSNDLKQKVEFITENSGKVSFYPLKGYEIIK